MINWRFVYSVIIIVDFSGKKINKSRGIIFICMNSVFFKNFEICRFLKGFYVGYVFGIIKGFLCFYCYLENEKENRIY